MSQFHQLSEGPWEKLSRVAVSGAEYDSPERQPHSKCLEGTRADLLDYIYGLLDNREKSQIIWLHGTAGVGKSAVAFTVAERMRSLKVTEETNIETRLAGTFFFSRKHTQRSTSDHFFATLAYQLASNFPSVKTNVNGAIRENPAVLDPSKSLLGQMKALFRQPLSNLQLRLRECMPPMFVIDALDECKPETVAELISLLGQALRDPDLPVIHILLTGRLEEHIRKAMQKEDMRSLVREIPVNTSGEGVSATISLDGEDVDHDIYIFLQHSFKELQSRHPDFPQPTADKLARLASRAGRHFIVATTMMKFIDDGYNDPQDRLELLLELTSGLLPGTEVYELYDRILSTCADPERAYLHLSVVAALVDPLPISQISKLLGPGQGMDVETTLVQLRSIMNIPTDSSLPVDIYHSSIRDYVSDPSNCSLPQVHSITSPHSLLAESSFRLMVRDIPKSTALLDALLELKEHSQTIQTSDPQSLQRSLAFIIEPPEPLHTLMGLLWLRGVRGPGLRSWLETPDGCAWLQTQGGDGWLRTEEGGNWLPTCTGENWLQTQTGNAWLQTESGEGWLQSWIGWQWAQKQRQITRHSREPKLLDPQSGREPLETNGGKKGLETEEDRERLGSARVQQQLERARAQQQLGSERAQWRETSGKKWLETDARRKWLDTPQGREWLETNTGREWLKAPRGREWLGTNGGREWLEAPRAQEWLGTNGGREWLETPRGREWLETPRGREWLETRGRERLEIEGAQQWLEAYVGQVWLDTPRGQEWLRTPSGREWLETNGGQQWLETSRGREWLKINGRQQRLQTRGQEWLQTMRGRQWLQTKAVREWLQTERGQQWLHTERGQEWLDTPAGQEWLDTPAGREWPQTVAGRKWLDTPEGQQWLRTPNGLQSPSGRVWLRTPNGLWLKTSSAQEWLQTWQGREWLQTQSGREWLQTPHGQAWQMTPAASVWVTMNEFSSTSEATSEYTIVPEIPLRAAFQVIEQFKNLPDFLGFPAFLAFQPQDHSTHAFQEDRYLPDIEVIYAMTAFVIFAKEARERSQSASDALKYACQNWAFHLLRALSPWDGRLNTLFKLFWDHHLLAWLERQWCLKGLRSCLLVLSEGQKLAKERLFQASGSSQS